MTLNLMTMAQVAEVLHTSRSGVYALMQRAENPLPMFRVAQRGKWLIKDKDFERWMLSCTQAYGDDNA
jgi:excisionase family DNA binding protein